MLPSHAIRTLARLEAAVIGEHTVAQIELCIGHIDDIFAFARCAAGLAAVALSAKEGQVS